MIIQAERSEDDGKKKYPKRLYESKTQSVIIILILNNTT